jgi:hypothetical protein
LRKSLGYSLALLSILLVLTATTSSTTATNYTKVGVKIGDTAVYHSSFTGSTINKTVIQVYGIVGTQVYLNFTDYYSNSTAAPSYQMITDTFAGSFSGWVYLIASNLTANDPIYSGCAYKINETKTMSIGGGTRTVNHLNATGWGFIINGYWDKTLGIMVKLDLFLWIGWRNYTMISFTSPGTPPGGLSTTTIVALAEGAVIIILLVYIVMSRRGHKGRK